MIRPISFSPAFPAAKACPHMGKVHMSRNLVPAYMFFVKCRNAGADLSFRNLKGFPFMLRYAQKALFFSFVLGPKWWRLKILSIDLFFYQRVSAVSEKSSFSSFSSANKDCWFSSVSSSVFSSSPVSSATGGSSSSELSPKQRRNTDVVR